MERREVIVRGGERIGYRVIGEGRPTILVHGWMVSGRVWDALAPELSGLRLIVPDLRMASAAGGAVTFTLDDLASDVLAVADDAGADAFQLVGHSMGGQIAQLVAATSPARVRAMALLSPVPLDGLPLPADVAAFFRSSGGNREAQAGILAQACLTLDADLRERALDDAGKIACERVAHSFELFTRGADASVLSRVTCPVLVVATDDRFLPPSLLEEKVVSRIPSARLEILRGPGHYPQLEAVAQTAAMLRAHFADLRGSAA